MALPCEDVEAGGGGAQPAAARRGRKMLVVGVAMVTVMAACVALLAVGPWGSQVDPHSTPYCTARCK
jgi:hypothetical protein